MMETIETRKRIEYRPILSVVRRTEKGNSVPVREIPDIRTQQKVEISRNTPVPVDYRGYIKCKRHDFF